MTLLLSKTGGALTLAKTYVGIDDPDAATYIAAVETADGQSLETDVKVAIHSFVKGCKADGIWPAVKASCILAGARTLAGCLVPLVGTAPTNNNFVSGDYNRKTGLVGDGSTKYLDSNTANSAAPLNNAHISIFASTLHTAGIKFYIGSSSGNVTAMGQDTTNPNPTTWTVNDTGSIVPRFTDSGTGFKGVTRNNSSDYIRRTAATSTTVTRTASANTSGAGTVNVFASDNTFFSDARLSFYSIGESLDLAKLDTRVSALMTAFGAAIP